MWRCWLGCGWVELCGLECVAVWSAVGRRWVRVVTITDDGRHGRSRLGRDAKRCGVVRWGRRNKTVHKWLGVTIMVTWTGRGLPEACDDRPKSRLGPKRFGMTSWIFREAIYQLYMSNGPKLNLYTLISFFLNRKINYFFKVELIFFTIDDFQLCKLCL